MLDWKVAESMKRGGWFLNISWDIKIHGILRLVVSKKESIKNDS